MNRVRRFAWKDGKSNAVMSDNIALVRDDRVRLDLESVFVENDLRRAPSTADPVGFRPSQE